MANIYKVDWKNVGTNLLYWRWRRNASGGDSRLLALIRSVMSSIQVLHDKLFSLQQETVEFLRYTGQHKVLEEFLNNNYDNVRRRIFIEEKNAAPTEPIELGLTVENVDNEIEIGLSGETVVAPIDLGLSNEGLVVVNFVVKYPSAVNIDQNQARGKLANYVLASKNYEFEII